MKTFAEAYDIINKLSDDEMSQLADEICAPMISENSVARRLAVEIYGEGYILFKISSGIAPTALKVMIDRYNAVMQPFKDSIDKQMGFK